MSLEDRSNIREVQGIANARKVASASVEQSDTQRVMVTDGFGEVYLSLNTSSYPAGLTPDQARLLAKQLKAAADRVEARWLCRETKALAA